MTYPVLFVESRRSPGSVKQSLALSRRAGWPVDISGVALVQSNSKHWRSAAISTEERTSRAPLVPVGVSAITN